MVDIFAGTNVLVTGASSGLGAEFARQLAAAGAHLVLTARSRDKLYKLADRLQAAHHIEARVVVGDLAEPGGAERLLDKLGALKVPIHHLINNAGFGSIGPFITNDALKQAQMVRLNCEALMLVTHHCLKAMVEREQGGILHVASVAGHLPVPYMATYAASKAFVLSFSLALAEEVRSKGVRVCALCPGPVPTGFQETAGMLPSQLPRLSSLSAEQTVKRALRAYESGADLCVPGVLNTAQTWTSKMLPRTILTRGAGQAMRIMGRGSATSSSTK